MGRTIQWPPCLAPPCKSLSGDVYRSWVSVMKPQGKAWLDRLKESRPFFSVAGERQSRPSWSMGGLAAGAVPARIRSSHGYTPQLPCDAREEPTPARPGDFFRN